MAVAVAVAVTVTLGAGDVGVAGGSGDWARLRLVRACGTDSTVGAVGWAVVGAATCFGGVAGDGRVSAGTENDGMLNDPRYCAAAHAPWSE